MRIEAAVAHAPGSSFEIQSIEIDEPRTDEILVRMAAVGICHTDLVFRETGMAAGFPAVFGHEGAGIVERVGASVAKVKPGDRVALTFRSCGDCGRCDSGDPAYCAHMPALNYVGARPDGSPTLHGSNGPIAGNFFGQSSFATFALAYERNVVRIPDDLPFELAAPLGCGVQTGAGSVMRSMACRPNSALVILGGGTVGLSAVLGGRVQQCQTIIVVEPKAERRTLARELGATHAIDPGEGDVGEAIRAIVPAGADYVLDTTGIPALIQAATTLLAPRGILGLVGVAPADAVLTLPINAAITFGFQVMGIIEGDSDPDRFIPELIRLHSAGRFPYERLIKTYPFDAINKAIAEQHEGACVKPVLVMNSTAAHQS